jgi:hypothetical protein
MNSYRFDLEKAMAAWAAPFGHNRSFSREELESSLRDRVNTLKGPDCRSRLLSRRRFSGQVVSARRMRM